MISTYKKIINLIGLGCVVVSIPATCDEMGSQLTREKLGRGDDGSRKGIGVGCCSIIS